MKLKFSLISIIFALFLFSPLVLSETYEGDGTYTLEEGDEVSAFSAMAGG